MPLRVTELADRVMNYSDLYGQQKLAGLCRPIGIDEANCLSVGSRLLSRHADLGTRHGCPTATRAGEEPLKLPGDRSVGGGEVRSSHR